VSSPSLEASPWYNVGGGRARRWTRATGCGSNAPLVAIPSDSCCPSSFPCGGRGGGRDLQLGEAAVFSESPGNLFVMAMHA
jgi:hypothetical protein